MERCSTCGEPLGEGELCGVCLLTRGIESAPELPEKIGRYRILRLLGEGGMGEVYKARDTRLNRVVAIKLIRSDHLADPARKQRFIQEAQAASALNHPNIVVIHDIASENGLDYMVMECVSGKTLDALIPRQGMRLGDALRIAIQMADALAKAHTAGIVHRDLKPSNVMVSEDGQVKVLDFGVAKLVETAGAEDDRKPTQRFQTEEGVVLGTAAYMSPEQAEGRKLDVRSDIFSFGSVLYEMMTGRRPFTGESKMATLSAILKDEQEPIERVPADLEKIIQRCLRKDRARRFQHMDDLRVALEEVREDSESRRLSVPAEAKKRRGAPKWAWAAGAVVILAAGFWALDRSRPKPPEPMRTIPLTTYPGSEQSPTFSPDGRQVAFAWNGEKREKFDIYVKLVDGGEPLQLTHATLDSTAPHWSPDGRFIGFIRAGSAYLISPLGGAERRVAEVSGGLAWAPDSKSIALTEMLPPNSGGVVLLNLETGERRKLTDPPAPSGGDRAFAFSPDGKQLAFVRWLAPAGSAELYVMELAGGQPRRIDAPKDIIFDVTWGPANDLIPAIQPEGAAALWRVPLDGRNPERIAGLDNGARWPALSPSTHRLAYSRAVNDENIWLLEAGEKKQLIASTRRDFNPQFSPDGNKIAFSSDRSGSWEIYVSDAQGGHPVQLTSFGNAIAEAVRWSPDGRDLAFAVLQGGNRDIYVISSEGGAPRRLTAETYDNARPAFSIDGASISFRSNRSGKDELWKMSRVGGAPSQVTQGGAFEAFETLDGSTLYFTRVRNQPGIWSMPVAGGVPQPVAGLEAAATGQWGVTQNGVCFVEAGPQSKPRQIFCWNASNRALTRIGEIDKPMIIAPPCFSVSRDGRRFLWPQIDHEDADLVLVENFH